MLTTDQLAAIRGRCERATPGPWIRESGKIARAVTGGAVYLSVDIYKAGAMKKKEDIDFIAHAREDVPALLNALIESDIEMHGQKAMAVHNEGVKNYLETDRDRWKARCEAMERAIKSEDDRCYSCTHSCISGSSWQFDEARFAGAGGDAR